MATHLVTFGDDRNFGLQRERVAREARACGWFDQVHVHTPDTISDFLARHRDFVESNPRGHGYWIWKPHVILRAMQDASDGDILFYMDSGSSILPHREARFRDYVGILESSDRPVMAFSDSYQERAYQKLSVLTRFGLEGDASFLGSNQVESAQVGCRKSEFALSLLADWQSLMTEDGYAMAVDSAGEPQLEGYLEHRHDQSILSILCKRMGAHIIDGECYGRGPFFSSRRTDHGIRAQAPDSFRMFDGNEDLRDWTWYDYLDSPVTQSRTIESIRQHVAGLSGRLRFGDPGENPFRTAFADMVGFLSALQVDVGIHWVGLSMDEYLPWMASSIDHIAGTVDVRFHKGEPTRLCFVVDALGARFPAARTEERPQHAVEWSRTWNTWNHYCP